MKLLTINLLFENNFFTTEECIKLTLTRESVEKQFGAIKGINIQPFGNNYLDEFHQRTSKRKSSLSCLLKIHFNEQPFKVN